MRIIFCLPGKVFSNNFLMSWSQLLLYLFNKGHEVLISQHYSSMVHFARMKCLGGNNLSGENQKPFGGRIMYDYIMWIDSDIVFKIEDFEKLLQSPHEITSGLYLMEDKTHYAVVENWDLNYFKKTGSFKFISNSDISFFSQKYRKVSYTGMGWMLIKYNVIEKIKYPWFHRELTKIGNVSDISSEDVNFCKNLQDAGFDIYIDTTIKVGHEKSFII